MVEVWQLGRGYLLGPERAPGSDSDPTEPGVANLIVAFGSSPWPCNPQFGQGACCLQTRKCVSIIEAVESAKECF